MNTNRPPVHSRSSLSWLLVCVLVLPGCARHELIGAHRVAGQVLLDIPAPAAPKRKDASLAYEHTVSIDLDRTELANRAHEIQAACSADERFGCTLLEVSVRTADQVPSATIRMRLAPGGVDTFVSAASKGGRVTDRATRAEDLAEPVADNERQLAMLTAQRDRLMQFTNDRTLKVEQLITVSRELASVQSQIETVSNNQANLHRRIDTELLSLYLSVPSTVAAAARTPVSDALQSFWSDFTDAVAQVIRFVAAAIPWLVVIVPGVVLIRLFWRWIGRWLSRREGAT